MGQRLGKPDVPEKFLTPQGSALEPAEARKFKKLVLKGKLAPFYPGVDDTAHDCEVDECPICFLYHKHVNRSRCCGQRICSECFVQIKTATGTYLGSLCPFCKANDFNVEVCGPKSDREKQQERMDEQRVLEHRIKERETPLNQNLAGMVPDVPEIVPREDNTARPAEEATQDPPRVDEVTVLDAADVPEQTTIAQSTVDSMAATLEHLQGAGAVQPSNHRRAVSAAHGHGLSIHDMLQCTEYLGVFPEDLGMRVDDFNELLLEQALINSMLENRQTNQRNQATQHNEIAEAQSLPEPGPDGRTLPEDPAEIRSLDSEATDPNWELVSMPRGSTGTSVGWERVSSEAGPDSSPHISRGTEAAQGAEGEPHGRVVASASTSDMSGNACPLGQSDALGDHPNNFHGRGLGATGRMHRQLSLPSRLSESEASCESGMCVSNCGNRTGQLMPVGLSCSHAGDRARGEGGEGVADGGVREETQDAAENESTGEAGLNQRRFAWLSSYSAGRGLHAGDDSRDQESGNVWQSLISALSLTGDINQDFRNLHIGMVFVRHDMDAHQGPVTESDAYQQQQQQMDERTGEHTGNTRAADPELEEGSIVDSERLTDVSDAGEQPMEDSSNSEASEVELPELAWQSMEVNQIEIRSKDYSASKTIAVENPDGSLALVTVPDKSGETAAGSSFEGPSGSSSTSTGRDSVDATIQRAIMEGDVLVRSAAAQADAAIVAGARSADQDWVERMRELDERLKRALQGSEDPSMQ
ncbi:unnamed protein product [Ostreobium quekettii]|uniref:RING-type domain-containing protein n=1 Tax=Ostreobium quekettii TaxID=121088 RepID=A0A8S1IU10_9CHLO|nr:unnamed protein product [Ostreobium quekettii]|eukprot:evm.model.scf_936.3 EVM.evm.TU.scf_936.3   scf_936:40704-45363(+)